MARTGRSASRTGDIHNIIVDLESGDVVAGNTKDGSIIEGRVSRVYKSQVSTWGIARLAMLRDDVGRRGALFTMTIKAPDHYKLDAQFNLLVDDRSSDHIAELGVVG